MSLGDDMPGSRAAPSGAGNRAGPPAPAFTEFGPFRLFPAERRLARVGETVRLGGRALDILILLVGNAGKVVTKQELMAQVWKGLSIDESGLRAQIASLRRALGDGTDGARFIVNVAGQGYCFVHTFTDLGTPHPSLPGSPGRNFTNLLPRRGAFLHRLSAAALYPTPVSDGTHESNGLHRQSGSWPAY